VGSKLLDVVLAPPLLSRRQPLAVVDHPLLSARLRNARERSRFLKELIGGLATDCLAVSVIEVRKTCGRLHSLPIGPKAVAGMALDAPMPKATWTSSPSHFSIRQDGNGVGPPLSRRTNRRTL
jgi:hypothetical protein